MRVLLMFLVLVLAGPAGAATITVNTATDDFGAVTSNCSLREAIQSANNNQDFGGCTHTGVYGAAITDNINLPTIAAGSFFTLTRFTAHDDANNSTDLDIAGSVNINGVSASNSVIRGNVSDPDSERDRLIHVLSGTVTLNDLTLRDGKLINQVAGAGLRTEPGSTTILNNVVVGLNSADGNAGGILNRGAMTINDSAITNNRAENPVDGGGGLFHSGTALTINNTVVSGNFVDSASGSGLYLNGPGTIDNCLVENNTIGGDEDAGDGGGIRISSSNVLVRGSTVRNNSAERGGGVACMANAVCTIEQSLVSANTATLSGAGMVSFGSLIVRDSAVESNATEGNGGGISAQSGALRVERSTVRANSSGATAGGIAIFTPATLVNVTVLDNRADQGGGGLRVASPTQIRSSTIAGNTSNADQVDFGLGGGLNIEGGSATLANSVVAGNQAAGSNGPDCAGDFVSAGFNFLQDSAGCTILNNNNDFANTSAGLGATANNGGPLVGSTLSTQVALRTRAPAVNSLLLDSGNPAGCTNEAGAALSTDQLGNPRALDGPDADAIARCDRGAVEFVIPNTAPTLSPSTAVNRQQGSLNSLTALAAVGDAEQAVDSLVVSTTTVPSGITVANLDNDNGTVRAHLSVGCAVPVGTAAIGLQVSDGSLSSTGSFNLGVTANQPPTQGNYSNQSLAPGAGATVPPTLAPQDAGSVSTVTVSASGGYTGTVTVVPATGVVSLGNVGPVGNHTLTITATDNCGASSQRSFTLNVQGDLLFRSGFEDTVIQPASTVNSAKLGLPVAALAALPVLAAREQVVLRFALGGQVHALLLRGDAQARQWRVQRDSDAQALGPWLPLPPLPTLSLSFRRSATGDWQLAAID